MSIGYLQSMTDVFAEYISRSSLRYAISMPDDNITKENICLSLGHFVCYTQVFTGTKSYSLSLDHESAHVYGAKLVGSKFCNFCYKMVMDTMDKDSEVCWWLESILPSASKLETEW